MTTKELDRCLDYIRNWHLLDIDDHHEQFLKGDMFGESHIEPLRRELIENLITLDRKQQTNVIIFYVNELNRVSITDYFESFEKREVKDENGSWLKFIELSAIPESGGPFFHMIYHLHLLLFMEIEKICKIYEIPLIKILEDQGIDFNTLFIDTPESPSESAQESVLPDIRPNFTADIIPDIFDILKDFFSTSEQPELLNILRTGGNTQKPLLFRDSGNRLADAFKQLFDCDIIKGCQKKELEAWICKNFLYRYRDKINEFKPRYVSDIISTTKDKCQRPILNVKQEKSTGNFLISKV